MFPRLDLQQLRNRGRRGSGVIKFIFSVRKKLIYKIYVHVHHASIHLSTNFSDISRIKASERNCLGYKLVERSDKNETMVIKKMAKI